VNNLFVQINTSATSSYAPAYTNIVIYFISTAYTTTTIHTHKLLDPFYRHGMFPRISSADEETFGFTHERGVLV
jgi:hypothetical protein